jgi:hypothetical protein
MSAMKALVYLGARERRVRTIMKTKRQKNSKAARDSARRHRHEAEAGAAGAVSGAAMGAMAGPPGAAAGAVIGGIVGALASSAFETNSADLAEIDRKLDAELGVSEGDIGAPNLEHPPAKIGAYSAASSGASSSTDSAPAEGPMQSPG